ncbi:MAG: hypothetical protein E7543_06150 [Ruminococcaceae bacterium]|nr:hypothetical protein [Oscillospiraceae bacterium]
MSESIIYLVKEIFLIILTVIASITNTFGFKGGPNVPPDDRYPLQEPAIVEESDLFWPEERIFPSFSEPQKSLIAFPADILPEREMTALACLQGFANAQETVAVILDSDVSKWLDTYGYSYDTVNGDNVFEHISTLCDGAVAGVILYSDELSSEYVNLASSIGNLMNAIPLTAEAYDKWTENGVDLPVIEDIRGLPYKSAYDIYKYFYDNYWQRSNRKILVVQRPDLPFQMRDLASATGGAVVYLSCSGGKETWLFKKYLNDMIPGESILTGWYAGQERELMTVAAQCGLSCVPSDFFSNPTVFAQKADIEVPSVPDTPDLENKIYIAYYLSDGDNIQYDMHAMRGYWDNSSAHRGKVAVNWTISPALVDVAPGMMNYYYTQATDKECFVCGPSGLGYTMPMNTYGANRGNQFRSEKDFTSYVDMTNGYLQRSGLRAVTIWDNLSKAQREIYTENGTYLYGLTVHNFTDSSLKKKMTGITNDTLIIQMTPGYFAQNAEGNLPLTELENHIKDAVSYLKYDGSSPVFVATQVSVWAFNNIGEVVNLEKHLSDYYESIYGRDVVEFVRADHFYNLYYEANKLPQDMTLSSALTAEATSNSADAMLTADGTCYGESIWTADSEGQQSITYSLGKVCSVNEITLYHAEAAGLDASLNTKSFKVEISTDGRSWTEAASLSDNTDRFTNLRFGAVKGAYVRVTVTDAGADGIARIADIDIFGIPA